MLPFRIQWANAKPEDFLGWVIYRGIFFYTYFLRQFFYTYFLRQFFYTNFVTPKFFPFLHHFFTPKFLFFLHQFRKRFFGQKFE